MHLHSLYRANGSATSLRTDSLVPAPLVGSSRSGLRCGCVPSSVDSSHSPCAKFRKGLTLVGHSMTRGFPRYAADPNVATYGRLGECPKRVETDGPDLFMVSISTKTLRRDMVCKLESRDSFGWVGGGPIPSRVDAPPTWTTWLFLLVFARYGHQTDHDLSLPIALQLCRPIQNAP